MAGEEEACAKEEVEEERLTIYVYTMYHSYMKIRLVKWGNSLGLRIPKVFAVQLGLNSDSELEMKIDKDEIVVSKPSVPTLDEMLSQVTDDNKHEEIDFGPSVGKEVW